MALTFSALAVFHQVISESKVRNRNIVPVKENIISNHIMKETQHRTARAPYSRARANSQHISPHAASLSPNLVS